MPTGHLASLTTPPLALFGDEDFQLVRAFSAAHPQFAPTPLHSLPSLAKSLGIGTLLAKDESSRFGLNAFKAAGATFAIRTLLARGELHSGDTLVCASEGNHGRAVAHIARTVGCPCAVYMAASVAPARMAAIESEGATVVRVDGTYDEAVRVMARDAEANRWLVISDTSWPGYTAIPRLIALGYTRLMDEDWPWTGRPTAGRPPDCVLVPGGVGGLLAGVAGWCHWRHAAARPRIVCVEPIGAACLQASARAGRPTSVPGPFDTTMGGLRCGEMSPDVFPIINSLVYAFVGIEDEWAFQALRHLARPAGGDPPIAAGVSGAAALGGLMALMQDDALAAVRTALDLRDDSRVQVLVTEGVTDPELYAQVLARG